MTGPSSGGEACECTDYCPESDNPCGWCAQNLDCYDPCPVIGFGCGTGGNDSRCDCCTDEQWLAAGGQSCADALVGEVTPNAGKR